MKIFDLSLPEGLSVVEAGDPDRLAILLADRVAGWLTAALAQRPRASLAVSGGRTPVGFFEALSERALAWERVDVTLVDERWVSAVHADSNERLVREHLLRRQASGAGFVPLKVDAATPSEGQSRCERQLRTLAWPLDVVVLGMGNDGHTASLFPGAPELEAAMLPGSPALCAAMAPTQAAHQRMTLTYPALASARHRALHLVGEDKLDTLARALARPESWQEMPVRAFLASGLTLFWSPRRAGPGHV